MAKKPEKKEIEKGKIREEIKDCLEGDLIEEFKTVEEALETLENNHIKKVVIMRKGYNPLLFRIYKSKAGKTYTIRIGEFT